MFFSGVQVVEQQYGPYQLVYLEQKGDYANTGKTIQKVTQKLKSMDIPYQKTFGIYLDNPKLVIKENLRAEVGAIVDTKDPAMWTKIKEQGLLHKGLPPMHYYKTEVPYRNFLSIFVGISKAYPALEKYRKEKNYRMTESMEIYESNKILYLMPALPERFNPNPVPNSGKSHNHNHNHDHKHGHNHDHDHSGHKH